MRSFLLIHYRNTIVPRTGKPIPLFQRGLTVLHHLSPKESLTKAEASHLI